MGDEQQRQPTIALQSRDQLDHLIRDQRIERALQRGETRRQRGVGRDGARAPHPRGFVGDGGADGEAFANGFRAVDAHETRVAGEVGREGDLHILRAGVARRFLDGADEREGVAARR